MKAYRYSSFGFIAGSVLLGIAGAYIPAIHAALLAQFFWIVSLRYDEGDEE